MLVECIFFFPCRASVCLKQASRQAFPLSSSFGQRSTHNGRVYTRDWQSVHTFVVPDRPERVVKFFFLSRGALPWCTCVVSASARQSRLRSRAEFFFEASELGMLDQAKRAFLALSSSERVAFAQFVAAAPPPEQQQEEGEAGQDEARMRPEDEKKRLSRKVQKRRERRHAKAVKEGRVPGQVGNPNFIKKSGERLAQPEGGAGASETFDGEEQEGTDEEGAEEEARRKKAKAKVDVERRREQRHAAAVAAGRVPGQAGRPKRAQHEAGAWALLHLLTAQQPADAAGARGGEDEVGREKPVSRKSQKQRERRHANAAKEGRVPGQAGRPNCIRRGSS